MVAGRPTSAYLLRIRVMWVLTVHEAMNRREAAACLLSVSTHARKGFARFALGSVAMATVGLAPCPVLVAPRPHDETKEVGS